MLRPPWGHLFTTSLTPPGTPARHVTQTPRGTPAGHIAQTPRDTCLPRWTRQHPVCTHSTGVPVRFAVTLQPGTITVARMGAEQRPRSQGVGVPQLPLHHLGRGPPAQSPAASWRLICQHELPPACVSPTMTAVLRAGAAEPQAASPIPAGAGAERTTCAPEAIQPGGWGCFLWPDQWQGSTRPGLGALPMTPVFHREHSSLLLTIRTSC